MRKIALVFEVEVLGHVLGGWEFYWRTPTITPLINVGNL